MKKFILRILLLSAAFHFVLPMINGIEVHGTFMNSVGLAVLFSVLAWVVSSLAGFISTLMAITTLGVALLVLIPLWFIGFWVLPAIVLKLVADMVPSYLAIHGWLPAFLGGLCMLFVGVVTDISTARPKRG